MIVDDSQWLCMILGGQTEARAQLSSTTIHYHEPFDQGFPRAHSFPSQRAQVTSNSKILVLIWSYVTRTVYSCFWSAYEETTASKHMEF